MFRCYERTENRGTGRYLSIIIQVYLDFSCQLPNKNKSYLLEQHENRLDTFWGLTKVLALYAEWLNTCKKNLPLSSNFHFLFLCLAPGVTSSFSVPAGAIGLYNIGLSCCLNSVLQVFFMNLRFTAILRRYRPLWLRYSHCCSVVSTPFFCMRCTLEGLDHRDASHSGSSWVVVCYLPLPLQVWCLELLDDHSYCFFPL